MSKCYYLLHADTLDGFPGYNDIGLSTTEQRLC